MRHLKEYKLWEQSGNLTPEQVEFLNQHVRGSWRVNPEGLVDVEGDFDCSKSDLNDLMGVRFGRVTGNFYCSWNKLTTLEGSPREVRGNFHCHTNKLTSLDGAPQKVGGDFNCYGNRITSLEGAPQEVKGSFICARNQIKSLKGAPLKVEGDFDCYINKLTSLEGSPLEVEGNFNCYTNKLTSLKGAPEKVDGHFDVSKNNLISLEGGPREVSADFYCHENPISEQTLEMIHSNMRKNPEMPYGAVLVALQGKISPEDWERLDKSAIDRLSDKARKGYKLLGGLGGI